MDLVIPVELLIKIFVATAFSLGIFVPVLFVLNAKTRNPLYNACVIWGVAVAPIIAWGLSHSTASGTYIDPNDPILQINTMVTSAGVSEEIAKSFLILIVVAFFNGRFNLPRAATVTAVAFGAAENFAYFYIFFSPSPDFLLYVLARTFLSLPVHIVSTNLALYGLKFPYVWPAWTAVGATYHNTINASLSMSPAFPIELLAAGLLGIVVMWLPWVYKYGPDGVYIECANKPQSYRTAVALAADRYFMER